MQFNLCATLIIPSSGYLDDYGFIYKLSSKLVHPSSMKIMAYETINEDKRYMSAILKVGVYFSQEFSLFLQGVVDNDA